MKKLDTKQVQDRLLEMAKLICEILENNNIPYMISFGTLLGAVRHRGFIPWDDDFDIFLFGEKYEEAISVLKCNLPNDMIVEDEEIEPLYFHSWVHVKDNNTIAECTQFPQDNIYSNKGISIDLYNIYKMKESEVDTFRIKENLKYQERKFKSGLISEVELVNIKKQLEKQLSEEKKKVYKTDRDAYGMVLNYRLLYHEEIFPLKQYIFEDTLFYGPNDFDSILKRFYGDYMIIPDKNKRLSHYSSVVYVE